MVTPTGGSPTLSWKQAFTFDRYGNRNFDEANTTTLPRDCVQAGNPVVCESVRPVVNPSVNPLNNRFSSGQGWSYDAAGNTTADPQGRTFTYDAENKQVKVEGVDANGNPVNTLGVYFYDGDGKRVKKVVPATGETTIFVYDASGRLVAEYSTIVVNSTDAKVAYLTADHLGSPRINTDANGAVTARHDYHLFGEEIGALAALPGSPQPRTATLGYTTDTVRKQFTSYERDNETELDFAQARMYGYGYGRFTSPDPLAASAKTVNPQSWNRYIYSFNCPLRFTDPSGMIAGDFYNEKGEYLGWDGVNDDNIYVVTKDKDKDLIRKNEKKGNSTSLSQVSSAVLLPSLKVRQATGEAVERTKKPTTDDLKGNRHEEGFVAGLVDGKEEIAVAPSGAFANIADPNVDVASIDAFAGAGNYEFTDITAVVHTHPGGQFTPSLLDTTSSSVGTTIGGGKPGSRFYEQPPSQRDKDVASQVTKLFPRATFVVAGVGNNTAYIYNSSGVRATFPLDKFISVTARQR